MITLEYIPTDKERTEAWWHTDRWLIKNSMPLMYIRITHSGYVLSPAMQIGEPMEALAGPFNTLDAAKAAYLLLMDEPTPTVGMS